MENKESALIAVREALTALRNLSEVWDDNREGVDLNELNAVYSYPFSEDLESVITKFAIWSEDIEEEINDLKQEEEIKKTVYWAVIKEWRDIGGNFIDADIVGEFVNLDEATETAKMLNTSEAHKYTDEDEGEMYISYCIEEYGGFLPNIIDYIEAEDLGFDLESIPTKE